MGLFRQGEEDEIIKQGLPDGNTVQREIVKRISCIGTRREEYVKGDLGRNVEAWILRREDWEG